jgi:hypothetical protein
VSQRSEEDRAADQKLSREGAASVQTAGMNTLQAALARAGIRKKDFEDISQARLPRACMHARTQAPAACMQAPAACKQALAACMRLLALLPSNHGGLGGCPRRWQSSLVCTCPDIAPGRRLHGQGFIV